MEVNKIFSAVLAAVLVPFCLEAKSDVKVQADSVCGVIKPMNAVNNGPVMYNSDKLKDNFYDYKAAHIPFARTHDSNHFNDYGAPHTVDISSIFPDFSADVRKASSYDFTNTDEYLKWIRAAGTEVFFRLGQSIEHPTKKYYTFPPEDYKKWARICEHIIMHYNEGWADGYEWNIRYWEIWNEPDLESEEIRKTAPKTWGGTDAQFFDFYATAATYLKKRFPNLYIGGPASCGNQDWSRRFLEDMSKRNVPIDFFSWHIYHNKPEKVTAAALAFRAMLDETGYTSTESILDEWNYVRNWDTKFIYSQSRLKDIKGAAFVAAVMASMQYAPLDMAMYYDFRPSNWCGAFDRVTFNPNEPYYAFYAWNKLCRAGNAVPVSVSGDPDVYCAAAKSAEGGMTILVVRYNEDNNVLASERINVSVSGMKLEEGAEVFGYLTDSAHKYTQLPVETGENGTLSFMMEPLSFILIEL